MSRVYRYTQDWFFKWCAGPSCNTALCFGKLDVPPSPGCRAVQVGPAPSKPPALPPQHKARDRSDATRGRLSERTPPPQHTWEPGAVPGRRLGGLGHAVTPQRAAAAPPGHHTSPPPRSPHAAPALPHATHGPVRCPQLRRGLRGGEDVAVGGMAGHGPPAAAAPAPPPRPHPARRCTPGGRRSPSHRPAGGAEPRLTPPPPPQKPYLLSAERGASRHSRGLRRPQLREAREAPASHQPRPPRPAPRPSSPSGLSAASIALLAPPPSSTGPWPRPISGPGGVSGPCARSAGQGGSGSAGAVTKQAALR